MAASTKQVIICGGGISGLAAAVELLENGVTDIMLIEAQNRLGGRIFSVLSPDNKRVIEIGAQWIHGEKKNPVYELCSSIGLVDKETKSEFSERFYFSSQDGTEIRNKDVNPAFDVLEKIFNEIEDEAEEMEESEDRSIGDLVQEKFNSYLQKLESKGKLDDRKLELMKAVLFSRLKNEMEQTGCGNMNDLSTVGWNDFIDCDGDNLVNLKFGYGQLIQHLCAKLSPDKVFAGEIVTKIQYPDSDSEDAHVTVTTYNPEKKTESVFHAVQCLCTFPLGCLKETHRELFQPSLPANKVKAIERLGFGAVNKVFLVFDEPLFTGELVQGLEVLWINGLEFELESLKKWNLQNNTFYKSFSTFEFLAKTQNMLYTFIVGEDAKYIEKLENECLIDVIHEMLSKGFPKLNIPRPKALFKSSWHSNTFARGSYTYIKMNSSIKDVRALAQPVNSKLYFSGEATDQKYYSTVHGAYQSGKNAAKSIIKYFEE